ncbi:glycosyltransferase [Microbacterium sp. SSW1-59]|uniref:glycosyltransferase n=1 Tax=Microbacterium xanthum TaxID=3079794 RepID=UPI002AD4E37F|nr:glycosyltransferase [Microbacterium sp. SSW1-59]MDZ8201269.1 glycosyltransferase [Microbacterium sp. SSW1-59]
MKKSVAIIGTRGYPSYYGGFETAVRKIAPYLADAGWDVTVYGRPESIRMDDPERDPRVHSRSTRGIESKSLSTLSYGLTASWDAMRRKPDVVIVMNVANGYFLPLLKLRGIRTLVNVDGIEWHREKWGRAAKKVFRIGARMTKWFADALVMDSHEIGQRWKQTFSRSGAFIPYGGDSVDRLPVEPGLEHRGYVLVVARFVPENTIPQFLEAARTISQAIPVVIVGTTGYGGELDSRAAQLTKEIDEVHWLGHISDDARLLALWQHAAVYFHGHSVGGTNPTLVQAMAAGSPVVARDTPYNREVLGEGGFFCDPNPTAIATTILTLAGDANAQREASTSNLERAKSKYTWDAVCEAYEAAITDLLTKGELT